MIYSSKKHLFPKSWYPYPRKPNLYWIIQSLKIANSQTLNCALLLHKMVCFRLVCTPKMKTGTIHDLSNIGILDRTTGYPKLYMSVNASNSTFTKKPKLFSQVGAKSERMAVLAQALNELLTTLLRHAKEEKYLRCVTQVLKVWFTLAIAVYCCHS